MKPQKKRTYLQKRAVILEPEEKIAIATLQQMRALRKDQLTRRKVKQYERKTIHKKKVEKEEAKSKDKKKEERKEYMRKAALKNKRDHLHDAAIEEGRVSKRQRT